MASIISQVSLGQGDSTVNLTQLDDDELQWKNRNWIANLQKSESGEYIGDGLQARKKGDANNFDGLTEKIEELEIALQCVSRIVREASQAKAEAEQEAQEWRSRFEAEREKNLEKSLQNNSSLSVVQKPRFPKEDRKFFPLPTIGSGDCSTFESLDNTEGTYQAKDGDHSEKEEGKSVFKFQHSMREIEFGIGENGVEFRKAPFRLAWGSSGETTQRHRHDVVSFEHGSISTVVRGNRQICLMWKSPPKRILIINKPGSVQIRELCASMIRWLWTKGVEIIVEPKVLEELKGESSDFDEVETWKEEELQDLHKKVDLTVTLGGDGTVLWAASLFPGPVPPVVSFACGSLGFMTPFPAENYESCLSKLMKGPLSLTLRNRLRTRIVRKHGDNNNTCIDLRSCPSEDDKLVLNEVAIDRGMSSALTSLDCFSDGLFVTSVQGDGLILSTTSGSTAYSLAAGGSMVHPEVPGILFTPICPHSLSFRPLILPEYVTIRVQVSSSARGQAWVSFDGKDRQALEPGDALILQMSMWPVPAVCGRGSTGDFLRSVNESLHWNMRKSQGSSEAEQNHKWPSSIG